MTEIRYLHKLFPEATEMYLEIKTLGVDLEWLDIFCEELYRFGEEKNSG